MVSRALAIVLAIIVALFLSSVAAGAQDQRIPVKVVVVAMFELGADTGDRPGELQYWVERKKPQG
jgi:purine nucleoside permease